MEEQKKAAGAVTADKKANSAAEGEPQKQVNAVLSRCILLTAKTNKDGDKIGVALLDYSAKLANGHFDVLGNDSPVISTWIPVRPDITYLLDLPVFSEIGCLVSGNGDFKKLAKVLTDREFDLMKSIMD